MFVLVRLLTARVVLAIGMDMGRRRAERVRGKGTANARKSGVCVCVYSLLWYPHENQSQSTQ